MVFERLSFGRYLTGFRRSYFLWILIGHYLVMLGVFYVAYTSLLRGEVDIGRISMTVINIFGIFKSCFSIKRPDPTTILARRQATAALYISIFNSAALPACLLLLLLPTEFTVLVSVMVPFHRALLKHLGSSHNWRYPVRDLDFPDIRDRWAILAPFWGLYFLLDDGSCYDMVFPFTW
jgi:hypothetical protein